MDYAADALGEFLACIGNHALACRVVHNELALCRDLAGIAFCGDFHLCAGFDVCALTLYRRLLIGIFRCWFRWRHDLAFRRCDQCILLLGFSEE